MMSHVAIPATGFDICVKDVYHDGVIDNLMDKNYSLFLAGLLSEDQYFESNEQKKTISLWLDDERDPTDPTIQQYFRATGYEVWVKTAHEAIELLKTGRVTRISLDHDLGPESAGTGMDVAKWIEENAFSGNLKRLRWSLHSQNPIGIRNMAIAMRKADKYWAMKR